MSSRGEEEAEAHFPDGFACVEQGILDVDAEGFEDIGRTGEGAGGAIAVFGYAGARSGGDDGGGGGNVEGAAGVATGAASIDHVFRARIIGQKNGSGMAAHDHGEGGKFRWGNCAAIERIEINGLIVRGSILPTPKENAEPLERQGAYGRLVCFALVALLLVIDPCPEGMADRFRGPLHEGLAEEYRTL